MSKADAVGAASGTAPHRDPGELGDDDFVGSGGLDADRELRGPRRAARELPGAGSWILEPDALGEPARSFSEADLAERLDQATQSLDPDMPGDLQRTRSPHNSSGPGLAPGVRRIAAWSAVAPGDAVGGNYAVVTAIERSQPVLALHGHVHESRGAFKLGAWLSLNPGSEYNTGRLRGVIVRLAPDRVVGHQFVTA